MTKHYVEFMYPGMLFSEPSIKEIPDRNTPIKFPKGAYMYRLFDRTVTIVDGEELEGRPKNHSNRFIKGEVFDLAKVKREVPNSAILQSNMRSNGWKTIIKCRQGFIQGEPDDVILQ